MGNLYKWDEIGMEWGTPLGIGEKSVFFGLFLFILRGWGERGEKGKMGQSDSESVRWKWKWYIVRMEMEGG